MLKSVRDVKSEYTIAERQSIYVLEVRARVLSCALHIMHAGYVL